MPTGCSKITKIVLPAIRRTISLELSESGFNQTEIAKALGLAQAAVSKYLSGNCSESIIKLSDEIRSEGLAKGIIASIKSGKDRKEIDDEIDNLCAVLAARSA